ncbi:MAG: 3-isopropylmalate dehydrogenase [Treponema sp.]|jgi:3-isopropylmalate dehydrogenase|nr:3-isopropylmalate dehydrogenase [Treponema sp.]
MNIKLAVIPGDGIGPEVTEQAQKILDKIAGVYNHKFEYKTLLAGGAAIDAVNNCLPDETIAVCKASDAVLLGAVGGWKWDTLPGDKRPEMALLGLRKELGLFANIRPALLFDELADACPLKREIISSGANGKVELDIVVIRELTGGIYFGEKGFKDTPLGKAAYDVELYAEEEVRRIAVVAFDMAMKRNKKVTSVDKANVLESSRLWRQVVAETAKNYPEVKLENLYIDNAAMQLVRNPRQFDVIVTSNMFGDILSDEASMITGSIGMLPSASLKNGNFGMYEPVHGSAPDIAGQDKANPMAAILSAAMMLRYTFALSKEAEAIERAVKAVLAKSYRTGDIYSEGKTLIGTKEAGDLIAGEIR